MKNGIDTMFAVICTGLTYIFGGWDTVILILALFMLLDVITGIICACGTKTVNSNTGYLGLKKKASIIIVLVMAVLLDRLLNNGTWIFRTLVCYFYIANEGISIFENLGKLGLPLPQRLTDVLEQLQKKGDGQSEQSGIN